MPATLRRAVLLLALAILSPASLSAETRQGRKPPLPVVGPDQEPVAPAPAATAASESSALFEEIEFGNTLVIEGKVEKPQVQFTLLKEPPPEKEIRFETSFLQNILKHERENTFDVAKRYGKD